MPDFPRKKNDILILAAKIARGIVDHPADFPNPPFDGADLVTYVGQSVQLIGDRQTKDAAAAIALELENDKIYHDVVGAMRHLERLARDRYADDPVKLAEIGLEPRAERRYLPPGPPRELTITAQGPSSATLAWKAPEKTAATGSVRYYRIERQIIDIPTRNVTEEWGVWESVTSETTATLLEQPRQVEIYYRIVAVNPNGDGPHSDAEMVVL